MVFCPLTVALSQLCSHSDAIPKARVLSCPAAHPEAAEQRCLTQLLGNEMETLPAVLQVFLASDRNAEFLFLSFPSKFSARRYLNLAQAGGGGDRGVLSPTWRPAYVLHEPADWVLLVV